MKKILFSLTYYLPYVSGISLTVRNLAEGLVEKNFSVQILTSQHLKQLPLKEEQKKVEIIRVPFWFRFSKGLILPGWIFRGLKLVLKNEVIIVNLPQVEGFWLLILGKVLRKKTIVIYHCDVVLSGGGLNWLIQRSLARLNFLSCLLADQIVNSNRDYAENSPVLSKFFKKVTIICPPIKSFALIKPSRQEEERLGKMVGKSDFFIGYVGRLAADKGVEYLFESIPVLEKNLRNFKIIFVGPEMAIGEGEYLEKIKILKKKYACRVVFLGYLSDEALSWFYRKIDVLVLPSLNSTEAFGMVQPEAMLMGIPVVASDLPGVRTPLKLTGMGIVVPPENSQEIAEAIIKIEGQKDSFHKAFLKAKKEFSFARSINKYGKLIG